MRDYFREKDWREHTPEELHKRRMAGLLGSSEEQSNSTTDKSGWEKDKQFSNTQNLLFQLGMNQMKDDIDPFGSEW
jgi:hypothetical protein